MQLHLLLSLARQQEGEDVTARLREVASLTEARGLKRLVADTHPTCIEQIQADTGSLPAADAEPLSAPTPPPKETAAKVVESNLLTPKEAEVLQLLVGNLTNKQIASAMGVGDQTIKWHLKNMFTKLQAGSRKHLIGRARMLGILD
jgi:LuxR family maltose regulon positive regulatory protein